MNDKNLNWEEIEQKISIICNKFSNLAAWHEDLAQELRIHAYYHSDNYYDLYRKAIDFWRKIQTKQSPEIPYFDLEIVGKSYTEDKMFDQSENIIKLIRVELERPAHNKWDKDMLDLASMLLDIIVSDINPELSRQEFDFNKSSLNHYINHRLNLSWVAEETGIGYKRIVVAMKFLEDTVRGLSAMNKIELPLRYFKGYYE